MYGDFCKEVVTGSSRLGLWWVVDNEGFKIPNRRRDLEERSPPVSANNYPDARSYLAFERDDKKACKMSCSEAFDTLIQGSCTLSRLQNLAKSLLSRRLIFHQVVVLEENNLRWLRVATLMRVVAHTASRLTLGKAIPNRKPLAVWSQGPTDWRYQDPSKRIPWLRSTLLRMLVFALQHFPILSSSIIFLYSLTWFISLFVLVKYVFSNLFVMLTVNEPAPNKAVYLNTSYVVNSPGSLG